MRSSRVGRLLGLLAFCVWACAGESWSPRPGIQVLADGRIGVGDLLLVPMHYDQQWHVTAAPQALSGQGHRKGDSWRLEGSWRTAAGSGHLAETAAVAGDGLHVTASLQDAGPTRVFCLAVELDGPRYRGCALQIDGQALDLPAQSPKPSLYSGAAHRASIPLGEGWLELSGGLTLLVQDNRSWGPDTFSVRIQAGKEGTLACDLRLRPYAPGEVPPPALAPDAISAGPRWRPIETTWETQPGSALDLSDLGPAPVAARVLVRQGHLVSAAQPERPLRLLGANLCFTANFPEHAVAERVAAAMRRLGYNAVRFHHHDGGLVPAGGDGATLDAQALDRLDYLFACCKRQGLWVTTDVYVSRRIPKGAIPELPERELGQEFKPLVFLLPSAMANWQRFATAFLGHRNPHTGLTWAEDPALASLSLINEDNLSSTADRDPAISALFEQRFNAWLEQQPAELRVATARAGQRARWLGGLQAAGYDSMRAYVRGLGVTAPITDANFISDWWSLAARDGFELVDNHAYHDHPRFPVRQWSLPYGFTQRDPVAMLLDVPAAMAQSRRLDRPFTVTELNFVYPNRHRAAYAVGVPAVAGLQDWDGIWRFAFAHDGRLFTESGAASGFDLVRDPIALMSERVIALLWRRGEVQPAPWAAAVAYDPTLALQSPNKGPAVAALALHARVGCLPTGALAEVPGLRCLLGSPQAGVIPPGALPVIQADAGLAASLVAQGLMPAGDFDLAHGRIRSSTGQMELDGPAGRLTLAGPRCIAAVLPGGGEALLGGHRLINRDAEAATVVVAALDGDLVSGRRLLVIHLTDALGSGLRFQDRRHLRVEDWGHAPMLVRAGAIDVELAGAACQRAWALDLGGARREELPIADGHRLSIAVDRPWGACLAWEIERGPDVIGAGAP